MVSTLTAQTANEMHARVKAALDAHNVVHVYKGRNNHLRATPASITELTDWRTVCGQFSIATVTGSPATERPLCKRCWR